ncbi:MAG: radical SAM protein [Bacteroidales bacterium]|nr:radical SAM protein [Bacteroidales bacterium]
MFYNPIYYDQPVFRPPSESLSLILQLTTGCSWNKCAFCEMYTSKKFGVKPLEIVMAEIDTAAKYFPNTRRIFLADGNAMVLPVDKLLVILNYLNEVFPKITRISAYAIPKDLVNKSVEYLIKLQNAGLKLIYTGIESGDDALLELVNKGETGESTIQSMIKAKEAGIKISVMIINGLGGKKYSSQHAENSAKVINVIQPEFLSTLVLSFPFGVDHFKSKFKGDFLEMNILDLLAEQKVFLQNLDLTETVFRSDHASNYLVLKGILNRDKKGMIRNLEAAIEAPGLAGLRQEWQRGL